MRQETGSNPLSSQDKISVRLDASGDLFVLEQVMELLPPQVEGGERLRIELLTKRMLLLPTSLLGGGADAASTARKELLRMGITPHRDEQVVSLSLLDQTVLVVVPTSLIEAIESRYGRDAVSYEVPLLQARAASKWEHLVLDSHLGITVIKLFTPVGGDAELKFADTYDTPTDASVVYWVQRVASAVGINQETPLYIYRCSGTVRRLLSRNFKNILICE